MPKTQTKAQQRITMAMVMLNAFATPLMLSAVNVALPTIASALSMNAVLLNWVPMAYLMASAMFVLIFGRIADMFGRKRLFLIGTSCVVVTSLIAAFSVNSLMLIFARFLQGMSAAMLYATQVSIVSSVFSPSKRGRVIGMTVSMVYLGLTVGPILGGSVIDAFGWRAAFLVHIPLALIVLFVGIYYVKDEWLAEERGRFDSLGSLLYVFSILVVCIGVSRLPELSGIILLSVSVLSFILFFLYENTHKHPVFEVTLFLTNRTFTFSCLASLIIYTATFANVIQVSLYLQYLQGLSATITGFVMMSQPLTMALFSPLAGRLSDKFEPRWITTAGMAISAVGLLLLANLGTELDLRYLIAALVTTGFGFSLFSSPNVNVIMGSVEKRFYGSANGIIATMRIIGQMSSIVLVTIIFAITIGSVQITQENYPALEQAIRTVFTIAALLCLPGLYFSMSRGKRKENDG